jgi:hypothetical protein
MTKIYVQVVKFIVTCLSFNAKNAVKNIVFYKGINVVKIHSKSFFDLLKQKDQVY